MSKDSLLKQIILREAKLFTKYGTVGFVGTVIDFGTLYFLVEYGNVSLYPAVTMAFLLAVVNNYVFNKIWTFKNASKSYAKQFTKFLIISLGGLAITNLCMVIFVDVLQIWYMGGKFLTAFIVPLWNYGGNKYWTFKV